MTEAEPRFIRCSSAWYASLYSHSLPLVCVKKKIFFNLFLIATSHAGFLLTSCPTQRANQSKRSISDYYSLDTTMSQQPRALNYIKLMKLNFAVSKHFSVSPALGYTQLRPPVNVSQGPTRESSARGFSPVWHHHPLELANRPTNYQVFLLGVRECRTRSSDLHRGCCRNP